MAFIAVKDCFEDILTDIRLTQSLDESIEDLQYIDENCITLLKTSTARQVFQVKDNHKPKLMPDRYYCAIDTDYCSCDAFRTGLINDSLVFCEHLIATKIGIAINKYKVEVKSEEELDRIWSKHLINYRQ